MRIVFSVEYDGSSFCGWQHQPSECSLQDVIQDAIKKFSGQPIKIIGSSRTDSGVHATWQIFHFDTDLQREVDKANLNFLCESNNFDSIGHTLDYYDNDDIDIKSYIQNLEN